MVVARNARCALRIALTAGSCALTVAVQAAPVVDHGYLVPTNEGRNGIPVIPGSTASQTLTVGLDGWLSRIDLQVGGNAAYGMTLEIGLGSDPNNDTPLASFAFTAPQWSTVGVYALTSIDVSAAMIDVDPGDVLVLSLSSTSATFGGWALGNVSLDGVYTGGGAYQNGSFTGGDVAFRTWVDPVKAVPEPASAALTLSALAIAAAMRRAWRPLRRPLNR